MGPVAGLEMLQPFAVSMLAGLVTATAVTLIAVPTLCLAVAGRTAVRRGPVRARRVSLRWSHEAQILAWFVAALTSLGVGGCRQRRARPTRHPAARRGGDGRDEPTSQQPARITISELAEKRLGIQTEPVRSGTERRTRQALVVPYAAIVYDADGASWAFSARAHARTSASPSRSRSIEGDHGTDSAAGRPSEPRWSIVGAPELVGAEAGISGEE